MAPETTLPKKQAAGCEDPAAYTHTHKNGNLSLLLTPTPSQTSAASPPSSAGRSWRRHAAATRPTASRTRGCLRAPPPPPPGSDDQWSFQCSVGGCSSRTPLHHRIFDSIQWWARVFRRAGSSALPAPGVSAVHMASDAVGRRCDAGVFIAEPGAAASPPPPPPAGRAGRRRLRRRRRRLRRCAAHEDRERAVAAARRLERAVAVGDTLAVDRADFIADAQPGGGGGGASVDDGDEWRRAAPCRRLSSPPPPPPFLSRRERPSDASEPSAAGDTSASTSIVRVCAGGGGGARPSRRTRSSTHASADAAAATSASWKASAAVAASTYAPCTLTIASPGRSSPLAAARPVTSTTRGASAARSAETRTEVRRFSSTRRRPGSWRTMEPHG